MKKKIKKIQVAVVSMTFVQLEDEGIDVFRKISTITDKIQYLHQQIERLWKQYSKNPTEETLLLIEMYRDCLHDYEEELNFILGE